MLSVAVMRVIGSGGRCDLSRQLRGDLLIAALVILANRSLSMIVSVLSAPPQDLFGQLLAAAGVPIVHGFRDLRVHEPPDRGQVVEPARPG